MNSGTISVNKAPVSAVKLLAPGARAHSASFLLRLKVDNCLASVESLEELQYFHTGAQKFLASAEFDLRG